MRIVFMGSPEFAIPSLRILLEHRFEIASVVTVPDKPAGRGLHLAPSPVSQFAAEHRLPLLRPERLKDPEFISSVKSLQPDLIVVVAFRILPKEIYTLARLGSFNLHASLLPKYRGAAPVNWAIMRGERETGVTTFFLHDSVDTGNIILQARIPITPDMTAGELHDALSEIGAEIVLHTVRLIEAGKTVPRVQDDSAASTAPKIVKDHCRIDWRKSSAEIHNVIRGLSPKPSAFTFFNRTHLKIFRSGILGCPEGKSAGEVLEADRRLLVAAGGGAVEIFEIQQEGKKKLPADEFLRGFPLSVGERFS